MGPEATSGARQPGAVPVGYPNQGFILWVVPMAPVWERTRGHFEVCFGVSSGWAGPSEAQPLGLQPGGEWSVTVSLTFLLPPLLQASQAMRTCLPDPQMSKKRTPQHCLWVPQSLVTPGQGHRLCLKTLHLQAPTAPGEICLTLVPGPQSPRARIPLNPLCLMTPGQQGPNHQKTPGHLPLRWTVDRKRNQTLTHPRKSTDRAGPQGT